VCVKLWGAVNEIPLNGRVAITSGRGGFIPLYGGVTITSGRGGYDIIRILFSFLILFLLIIVPTRIIE
jgi:hypothetical protein